MSLMASTLGKFSFADNAKNAKFNKMKICQRFLPSRLLISYYSS